MIQDRDGQNRFTTVYVQVIFTRRRLLFTVIGRLWVVMMMAMSVIMSMVMMVVPAKMNMRLNSGPRITRTRMRVGDSGEAVLQQQR